MYHFCFVRAIFCRLVVPNYLSKTNYTTLPSFFPCLSPFPLSSTDPCIFHAFVDSQPPNDQVSNSTYPPRPFALHRFPLVCAPTPRPFGTVDTRKEERPPPNYFSFAPRCISAQNVSRSASQQTEERREKGRKGTRALWNTCLALGAVLPQGAPRFQPSTKPEIPNTTQINNNRGAMIQVQVRAGGLFPFSVFPSTLSASGSPRVRCVCCPSPWTLSHFPSLLLPLCVFTHL